MAYRHHDPTAARFAFSSVSGKHARAWAIVITIGIVFAMTALAPWVFG